MEVTATNNIQYQYNNPNIIEKSVSSNNNLEIAPISIEKFNFEKTTMKPDEVKSFLYMLLGANGLRLISRGTGAGSTIDKLV